MVLSEDYVAAINDGSSRYKITYDIYDKNFNKVLNLGEIYQLKTETVNWEDI